MWEKEIKIIDGLGKLYPEFVDCFGDIIRYEKFRADDWDKAYWVYYLCRYGLNQRIPSLEIYIKKFDHRGWYHYNRYFRIKE